MGSSELISEISTVTTSLCDPNNNLQRCLNSLLKTWSVQDLPLTSTTLRARLGWTCSILEIAFEAFIECLKLYDKLENGTMMLGELEHILLSLGEKLEREEVDILIKECYDPEDDDGFIPYEPFLRRVCAGPHPEMYEDW